MQLKQAGSGRLPDGLTAAAPSRWLSNTHSRRRSHTHRHTHMRMHACTHASYCMLMIFALGAFVSGLATHTFALFGCAAPVAVPLTPHLQLSTPAACQSSGPQTETWDWPTTTKEDLIDRRRQRGARTVTALCAGRRRMMLVSGSLGSCAADTGDHVSAVTLSSHQIQSFICKSLFCGGRAHSGSVRSVPSVSCLDLHREIP